MRIQVRELAGRRPTVHVAVDGDLDIKTAPQLRELLALGVAHQAVDVEGIDAAAVVGGVRPGV